jgi:hypothetical protein
VNNGGCNNNQQQMAQPSYGAPPPQSNNNEMAQPAYGAPPPQQFQQQQQQQQFPPQQQQFPPQQQQFAPQQQEFLPQQQLQQQQTQFQQQPAVQQSAYSEGVTGAIQLNGAQSSSAASDTGVRLPFMDRMLTPKELDILLCVYAVILFSNAIFGCTGYNWARWGADANDDGDNDLSYRYVLQRL